jgi:hypothetical protein
LTRRFEASLPAGVRGELPVRVVTAINMAVFDWKALGEPVAILRLAAARKSMADSVRGDLDGVDQARQSSAPLDALRAMTKDRANSGILRQILTLTESDAPPSAVESAVSAFRRYQLLLDQHAGLTHAGRKFAAIVTAITPSAAAP